jgi:hypothetical protein
MQVYVECGAEFMGRNHITRFRRKQYMPPAQVDLFRIQYNNRDVYQTVMNYLDPIWFQDEKGRWLINAADSLKYGNFYMDFDTDFSDPQAFSKIREDIAIALRYLKLFLNIDPRSIYYYFSGFKGFHLMVNAEIIGIEPHLALNEIYKDIIEDIGQYIKHDTLDRGIYDDKRMFRLVNSINGKSGLYKIPLTADEFLNFSYEEIKNLAKQPRTIHYKSPVYQPRAKLQFQKIVDNWTKRINIRQSYTGKIRKLKVLPPCIAHMRERTFRQTVDQRNNSATALSSFYFQQGLEREDTLDRLILWNEQCCLPPLKEREIRTIVHSVYNGQYRYGCGTFKKVSGLCDKDHCPLFHKELNIENQAEQKQKAVR